MKRQHVKKERYSSPSPDQSKHMLKRYPAGVAATRTFVAVIALLVLGAATPIKPDLLSGLVWRNVGPFRGGRISAVSGAIGEPGVFYAGTPAGGVWKTTSAGETWYPVFDAIKEVSSIGAVEVAPSNPNIVYVGAGDKVNGGGANVGNGIYKSEDAGATWRHLGLDDSRVIPSILVDPKNPDLVLVASEGNLWKKSESRGVFRSTDGGRTWTKTLYVNDSTGVQKIARAFDRPDVIFATTIRHYNAAVPASGIFPAPPTPAPGTTPPAVPSATRLYKSTDEGMTWTEVTGGGLPRLNGCEYVAVAQNTNAQRVFVIGNNGLFRTDDGGTTWKQMDKDDDRIRNGQGGYNCGIYVNTKNPDVVYSLHTSSYISTDGGNTFTGFKGAPGGDDPQQMWLDPTNSNRILFGVDQGATVTLDGGKTWSSWYNQSTEQVYHISVDNSFPYWIYATQQDAGSVRTRSRGNYGAISPVDQSAVPAWEWGTIIPDPLNANTVYASGNPGGLEKVSYPSEQWVAVSPTADPGLHLRSAFSQPIQFAPWNKHELLAGFQFVMATTDAGLHWKKISPDVTWPKGVTPVADTAVVPPGTYPRGAIETMSASTVGRGTIWVGTNTGVIKVTKDEGKTWDDVSIPNLPFAPRALISIIDASHTDAGGAYVAVDESRSGDYSPYFYRTHDFGKTWTRISNGLPSNEPSASFPRVIRADPMRAGLLVAGTESGMYVSFDDGDNWQSLQLNLPNTSMRDIAFAGNDLVVGTYGRGIWVLDDYAVLRQMTPAVAAEPVHLFKPDATVRARRNTSFDTPLPPEVPHALNPPDGALIYYSLDSKPSGEVTIDILDSAGTTLRHISSTAAEPVKEAAKPPHPNWWVAPPYALPAMAGLNRANWDLRLDAPPAFTHTFEINANPGLTPTSPEGIIAPPGTYTVKLNVNGKSYTQKLTLTNDPRSPATNADVKAQYALLRRINDEAKRAWDAYAQVDAMRSSVKSRMPADTASEAAKALKAFRAKLDTVGGNGGVGGRRPPPNFYALNANFIGQLTSQDNADQAPTEAMVAGFDAACTDLGKAVASWTAINSKDLADLNSVLGKNGAQSISAAAGVKAPVCAAPHAQSAAPTPRKR
ncbi:MAG TPA: hypothetical protein VGQ30_05160 [Gemmatimonadaceae bacterium]|nr:hypothetical protein [Gemmatimonadaceae bacterium]